MGYQYWNYDLLKKFCTDAFLKFGFNEAEADTIQDVLLTSDLFGIESTACSAWCATISASKRA